MEIVIINKIMRKIIIPLIQCILYPISPYIARELCLMNKSLVDNLFLVFFVLLTISIWFSIWKLEKLFGDR